MEVSADLDEERSDCPFLARTIERAPFVDEI